MKTHGLLLNVVSNTTLPRSAGIYRVAHFLREQSWDIEVIDYANFWTVDQLKELFRSRLTNQTKFIGFSHMFNIWYPVLEEFGLWVKQHYPDIVLISGSSTNPLFESNAIDYYIKGYGEHAVKKLLDYLFSTGTAPKYNIQFLPKKIIDANQWYPAYPMSSLMIKYEDRDFVQPDEWLTVEFARGCKFACAFCNFPVIGVKGDYTRDAEDFKLQMIDTYDRFGITNYSVADETFNDRTDKITKFANVVEKLNFNPWFSGYIRADLLVTRPKDREELLRMNFVNHFYGVETFNTAAGKSVGKGMDGDRLKQGLIDIKKYFTTSGTRLYRGSIGLIAGLPHESIESLLVTKQWLIDNWQGESFGIYPLSIPLREIVQPSKMTVDYKKYGYRELTIDERNEKKLNLIYATEIGAPVNDITFYWKNEYMDFFQASELTDEFVKLKFDYDFRPGGFALAHRLSKPLSLEQMLTLKYSEFKQLEDGSAVYDYINRKLSI